MTQSQLRFPGTLADVSQIGGKAAALDELAGLGVPPWFALSPAACPGTGDPASWRVDPPLRAQVDAAVAQLGGGDPEALFAVRSSGVDEDGGAHSFAGQFASYLAVPPGEVAERIAAVWASAYSERIRAYRDEHGLGPCRPPAVLVQRLVHARCAGVAFSIDPVSGSWDQAVVAAVRGLGTALVDGRVDADTWRVDRAQRVSACECGAQHEQDRWSHEGVVQEPVPAAERDTPCLAPTVVAAIARLARHAAERRGAPQDIEWAWDGERLWLLQSRPITTLDRLVDQDARAAIWDTSNIAESYGGTTTPLTFSFASGVYAAVYRQFCVLMGVPRRTIAAKEEVFRGLLGLIRGRMHYDLLNWYRLLACFPGYRLNRRFMEQMMGVREPLPPALQAQVTPPGVGAWGKCADAWRLLRTLGGLLRNHWTLPRQVRRFQQRLDAALAEPAIPWSQQRPDELVQAYHELEDRLLLRWDAPLVNDFLAMIFYGVLKGLCGRWCDDTDGSLQNDLVGGDGTVISAEPARRMRAMAELVREDAEFAALLRNGERRVIAARLPEQPALAAAIASYLDRFADRCMEELKLESQTLRDDPMSLYRAIGHLAARAAAPVVDHAAEARQRAAQRVRRALRWRVLRRPLFAWVLRNARARVRDRENLRFERTRLFGRVRTILLELGRRYAAAGVLDDPRDVFWLELDEVLRFVTGGVSCPDLRALAAARRTAAQRAQEQPAPADRFTTHGWVFVGNSFASETTTAAPSGEERVGLGCCPGRVSGRAVVVRDPRGVELPADSILVAERTDPGWIMLFPAAAGLVVERGSLLSHSAIVARELGLPCAVAVPGATGWLQTGDLVELDGASGRVSRVERAP